VLAHHSLAALDRRRLASQPQASMGFLKDVTAYHSHQVAYSTRRYQHWI